MHVSHYLFVVLGKYGHSLHVWDWQEHTTVQHIDLGEEGMIPLELRFLHNPDEPQGYVAAALSSNVIRFFKNKVCRWDGVRKTKATEVRHALHCVDHLATGGESSNLHVCIYITVLCNHSECGHESVNYSKL